MKRRQRRMRSKLKPKPNRQGAPIDGRTIARSKSWRTEKDEGSDRESCGERRSGMRGLISA